MASRVEWQQRVAQWKSSGLTAEAFAARRGLKAGTLRWWSSTLGRAGGRLGGAGFALVVPTATAPAEPVESPALDVVLPSGRVVRVRRGFDPAFLGELLVALETL